MPRDGLCGIAVEGLSHDIEEGADKAVVEIADTAFFHGGGASFELATCIEVVQFKYSIARAESAFRVADAKKTLQKFTDAEASFITTYGKDATWERFRYSIATNRPISPDFTDAIQSLAEGRPAGSEQAKEQRKVFCKTVTLAGDQLKRFCSRLTLVGSAGTVNSIETGNAATIADWSASNDVMARARIGDLRDLVRKKAGHAGQGNNIIRKVDVLACLGLSEEGDLLPTPQAFPKVGEVVERDQIADFISLMPTSGLWLVHAPGGIGKTVFVQSLARRLQASDEVILFDCFGGGAYRSPIDRRHAPERGLMHIVNELACRGLCDPILPNSSAPDEVVRRAVQRFRQVIDVVRRTRPSSRLIIIMDAADNAGMEAKSRGQPAFPCDVTEGLSHIGQIEGLVVVATARPERRSLAVGQAKCLDYPLSPFSIDEASAFILARRPEATRLQVEALVRRADGNPRVIANLIEPDRSLAGESETKGKAALDDLIEQRIGRAIALADEHGARADAVAAFLCALSVLPPPVPVAEIAAAFDLPQSEIESLAADLSPLLERTRLGLIFRDEPTETLVKAKYGARLSLLNNVVTRLTNAQAQSTYAARALPGLLFAMGRVQDLHTLAFDQRFPPELDSEVAKRSVRLNRLKTALRAAAGTKDFDKSVNLLVELSSIALMDERGQDYLLEFPELIVALEESESLRRLFEIRTAWPGMRHARLAIAYTTDDDLAEAHGHAVRAQEWMKWSEDQNRDQPFGQGVRPEISDRVSVPFYLFARGRWTDVGRQFARWKNWYAYTLGVKLFELAVIAQNAGKLSALPTALAKLCRCPKSPPALLAAAFTTLPTIDPAQRKQLLARLASALKEPDEPEDEPWQRREDDSFRNALARCALAAVHLGLRTEAQAFSRSARAERYALYALNDPFTDQHVVPWLLSVAVQATLEDRSVSFFDCCPSEFWSLVRDTAPLPEGEAQEALLQQKLAEKPSEKAVEEKPKPDPLSASERYHANDKIKERIHPLHALARLIQDAIAADSPASTEKAVAALFASWRAIQAASSNSFSAFRGQKRMFNALYASAIFQVLSALSVLNSQTAEPFSACLGNCEFTNSHLKLRLVEVLAVQPDGATLAGRIAIEAIKGIELEDEVTNRASLFGRLARALLPADRAEAAALFKRGLNELDALGSGDHDFMNELLVYAGALRNGPISSVSALRLAKICEINNYDSHKFPWPLAAKAFSRIWGLRYIPQISRWHDRDKAGLDLTLPSALSFLIKDKRILPEDAVPLLDLVDVVQMWDWGWKDIIQSLVDVGADNSLFEAVLRRYEADNASGSFRRVQDFRAVLEPHPALYSRFGGELDRLAALAAQRRKVDRSSDGTQIGGHEAFRRENEANRQKALDLAQDFNPVSVAELELLIEKLDEIDGALDTKNAVFASLRPKIRYSDRSAHVQAIVGARNLNLFDKNALLKEIKDAWLSDSPSQLSYFAQSGAHLVTGHAKELMGAEWGFAWELNKLADLSGRPKSELAMQLVEEATSRELQSAATTWLNLASLLSERATAAAPGFALERLLDGGAARLADTVGDGIWRSELDAGDEPMNVAAGLVWFCLGSPKASQRWRAAHVVREFARGARWQVIERLFGLLESDNAGAFQDQSLPFFFLHARLWFLLAIARVALDHPQHIVTFADQLERIAMESAFPHVAICEAARRALGACLTHLPKERAASLRTKLATVNQSPFPKPTKEARLFRGNPWGRPDDAPEQKDSFSFEYDFEKYNLNGLGRLFGMQQWEIGDACIRWIRRWDDKAGSMYDFAGRHKRGDSNDYTAGTKDSYHSYGTYLAWHALALAGGELLQERPLAEVRSYEDPWDEWLKRYSITRDDGLWLADGTSLYPAFAFHDLLQADREKRAPSSDRDLLLSLAGIQADLTIQETLTVSAAWSSPDGVNVSISSALVPDGLTELAARTVGTESEFNMWLPTVDRHGGDYDENPYAPLEPWISSRDAYARLDEEDPSASKAALEKYRPSREIRRRFRLTSKDPWSSVWLRPRNLPAFISRSWGIHTGEGRSDQREQGNALSIDRKFLSTLLTKLDRSLLLLIKLRHYRESSSHSTRNGDFAHSWIIASVDRKFGFRVFEANEADKALISRLPEHSQYDFQQRRRRLAGTLGTK